MRQLITILKKWYATPKPNNPVGRWSIENCHNKINQKIDLSNEDHCGPCGQYALLQLEIKQKAKNEEKLNANIAKMQNTITKVEPKSKWHQQPL